MKTKYTDQRKQRTANIGFAKWRVKCLYDSLVQGSTLGILMNICAENPPLRKAEKRYPSLEKSPSHIYTHLVFANPQANPKKPKEYKFSHRSQTVNKFGEQIQGITKKTNYI